MILLASNVSLEKSILFRCCHIDHVRASHHHLYLVPLTPWATPDMCWRKCCLGFIGIGPTEFTQDNDSHQRGLILLQWKNMCPVSSSMLLQKRYLLSFISTCRLWMFLLVGSLSLSNLHAKTSILFSTFNFHNSAKAVSSIPSNEASLIALYALLLRIDHWSLSSTPTHLTFVIEFACFPYLLGMK